MAAFSLPPRTPGARYAELTHSHICIRVPDYAAAKDWYTSVLKFRVVHEWPEPMLKVDMGYFAAPNDDRALFEIVGGNDPAPSPRASEDFPGTFAHQGFHHACFTVPDIEATVARLEEDGVTIVAPPFVVEVIGRKIAFFADPWGNLFEMEEVLD
jgi:lactoylglutathione lyase/glyoxylase I family protein